MGRSSIPIRLSQSLLKAAGKCAARQHRSAATQIEHWAMIGQIVEPHLTPNDLDHLAAGLSQLRVEPAASVPLPDLDEVMEEVNRDRADGTLSHKVAGPVRYQASPTDPTKVELVTPNAVITGEFVDGRFVPDDDSLAAPPSPPRPAAAIRRSR